MQTLLDSGWKLHNCPLTCSANDSTRFLPTWIDWVESAKPFLSQVHDRWNQDKWVNWSAPRVTEEARFVTDSPIHFLKSAQIV
jgi:hypothetical protein